MKWLFLSIVLGIFSSPLMAQERPAISSVKDLARNLQMSLQTRNGAALEQLFHWDGAIESSKRADLNAFASFFDEELQDGEVLVVAAPVDPNVPLKQVTRGYHIRPNIKVEGILIASYAIGNGHLRVTRPYGLVDGVPYLAATRLETVQWSGPKDLGFRVTITEEDGSKTTHFNGYIEFNASGIDLRQPFDRTETSKWNFQAQHVKDVVINRLAGTSPLTITISQGPMIIFKDRLPANQNQLIYQK